MAATDWTLLATSLDIATVDRGATAGIPRPNGGTNFCYGFNSQEVTVGTVGLFANQAGFAPMPSGGTVRGAIQRGVSGGPENFAPFLFIGAQGDDVTDQAYILGLSDAEPHRLVLYKGSMSSSPLGPVPDLAPDPDANGVMLRSTLAYSAGTWLHLRLDMIVQGTGDVLLQVYENNLTANPVTAPVWTTPVGMEGPQNPTIVGFVDDALGVNTGSAPFTSGRGGFGFWTADTTRRGYLDHVQVGKQ